MAHPQRRLHGISRRGRAGLLARQGRWRTPLGCAGAFAAYPTVRRALGGWLQRVVFSDPSEALLLALGDFNSVRVPLAPDNLDPALRASGAIPFVLQAVHYIPGAPPGAYWDGGITDHHLHLGDAAMPEGLVLYPHFQRALVPAWQGPEAPPCRHTRAGQRGGAGTAPRLGGQAAQWQAARSPRFQGLPTRSAGAHSGLAACRGRGAATGRRGRRRAGRTEPGRAAAVAVAGMRGVHSVYGVYGV